MTLDEKIELLGKARTLAFADRDANGGVGFPNAPYRISHNGERYVVRIVAGKDESVKEGPNIKYTIYIERPVSIMTSDAL